MRFLFMRLPQPPTNWRNCMSTLKVIRSNSSCETRHSYIYIHACIHYHYHCHYHCHCHCHYHYHYHYHYIYIYMCVCVCICNVYVVCVCLSIQPSIHLSIYLSCPFSTASAQPHRRAYWWRPHFAPPALCVQRPSQWARDARAKVSAEDQGCPGEPAVNHQVAQ